MMSEFFFKSNAMHQNDVYEVSEVFKTCTRHITSTITTSTQPVIHIIKGSFQVIESQHNIKVILIVSYTIHVIRHIVLRF